MTRAAFSSKACKEITCSMNFKKQRPNPPFFFEKEQVISFLRLGRCLSHLLVVVLLTGLLAGCSGLFAQLPGKGDGDSPASPPLASSSMSPSSGKSATASPDNATPSTNASASAEPPPSASASASASLSPSTSASVEATLDGMTMEEKVGQMMFPAFRNTYTGAPLLFADESTRKAIKKWKPGGIILFSVNLDTVPQTAALIRQLKGSSAIPLLIGVDEEGGRVSRLADAKKLGAVPMPQAAIIGKTGNPELAREAAAAMGTQLSELGFNLDFAPVADINTNPDNPVIGDRAYGTKPAPTSLMVVEALRGLQDAGIIPVVKHFPGHGDTQTDSHLGLAIVPHDRKRMDAVELVPFRAAIAAGAPVVMTGHINTPGISDKNLPATLNPDILTDLLRTELHFDGVIITDAMEMGAITKNYDESESTLLAVEAGADMLLVPVSLERACMALLDAVKSGRISERRMNDSVRRILTLKATYGLERMVPDDVLPLPQRFSDTNAWQKIVARIDAAAR